MKPLDEFQVALRRELAGLKCPLPAPLDSVIVFPRAFRGRATLVHWRQGDSSAAEWALAIRKRHGWCLQIPPGIFLLDLDKPGVLELLAPRFPAGYGLVQSSPGRYHIWLCGTAPPGAHIGQVEGQSVEVHAAPRLATLPPSLHIDIGKPYRWLRPFLGTAPTSPEDLGIVIEVPLAPKRLQPSYFPVPPPGAVSLHELMEKFTGQDGRHQGQEWAFRCPRHDDSHASLMVSDAKGVFFCHGAGCGFKGNRLTLEKLAGIRPVRSSGRRFIPTFEVKEEI